MSAPGLQYMEQAVTLPRVLLQTLAKTASKLGPSQWHGRIWVTNDLKNRQQLVAANNHFMLVATSGKKNESDVIRTNGWIKAEQHTAPLSKGKQGELMPVRCVLDGDEVIPTKPQDLLNRLSNVTGAHGISPRVLKAVVDLLAKLGPFAEVDVTPYGIQFSMESDVWDGNVYAMALGARRPSQGDAPGRD